MSYKKTFDNGFANQEAVYRNNEPQKNEIVDAEYTVENKTGQNLPAHPNSGYYRLLTAQTQLCQLSKSIT